MASVDQVKRAIDDAARGSGFSCKAVSWEDAQRFGSGGSLSCVGPNISDVRLYEKTGRQLYTVRSDNWNERLGYVAAGDVAMITGNESATTSAQNPTTLREYLRNVGTTASYVGCNVPSLFEPTLDNIFGIRFQTVFLPVAEPDPFTGKATTEFTTEVYNYQTRSETDPKNMLLLSTPQGTSVQTDSAGCGKVFFHSVDSAGMVHRYWLEAEQSTKKVGGAQTETTEEMLEAASRGKATAVRIGPSSMGTRFNVQMLIQVPLKQAPRRASPVAAGGWSGGAYGGARGGRGRGGWGGGFGGGGRGGGRGGTFGAAKASSPSGGWAEGATLEGCAEADCDDDEAVACFAAPAAMPAPGAQSVALDGFAPSSAKRCRQSKPSQGTSNAARVSRGSLEDTGYKIKNTTPVRDSTQHGTITVTMYYTVVGGVPSPADVRAAIRDLDDLYKACPSDKKLVNCTEVTAGQPFGAKPKGVVTVAPPPAPVTLPTVVSHPGMPVGSLPCRNGHAMAPNSAATEPPHGWWCDGCGVFVPPKGKQVSPGALDAVREAVGMQARGFGCRQCDFDVCLRCACAPRCGSGHTLVAAEPTAVPPGGQATRDCSSCHRMFAIHVARMHRCPHCPGFAMCEPCFNKETDSRLVHTF